MRVFYMKAWMLTFINQLLFGEMVFPEGLLQNQIPGVGIVSQDPLYAGYVPGHHTKARGCSFPVQLVCNSLNTHSRQIHVVDAPDGLGLFRLNLVMIFFEAVTQQRPITRDPRFEILFYPPLLILTGGKAFFLGAACQNTEHELTIRAHGMDLLLLKINVDTQLFSSRMASRRVTVFLAKRDTDFVIPECLAKGAIHISRGKSNREEYVDCIVHALRKILL